MDPIVPYQSLISTKFQVVIPPAIRTALGLAKGDDVWFALHPKRPRVVVMLPADQVEQIWLKGWGDPD